MFIAVCSSKTSSPVRATCLYLSLQNVKKIAKLTPMVHNYVDSYQHGYRVFTVFYRR